MPSLAVFPATAPGDVQFPPASAQALLNFVAAYIRIAGLEALSGVLISEVEPAAADRDKAWLKRDAGSGRALALHVYNGGWLPLPFIVPSGEKEPGGAKKGELFYNTQLDALRLYDGTAWTTNLWPGGDTASRPKSPSVGDLYFDTEIARLLRFVTQGWSTVDGGIGDIKMVDLADPDDALAKNPGWTIFEPMAGRFPLGYNDTIRPQADGGAPLEEMKLDWAAQRRSASGGSREPSATFLAELKLNGVVKTADGTKSDAMSAIGSDTTINLKPPYRALIFLRKDY